MRCRRAARLRCICESGRRCDLAPGRHRAFAGARQRAVLLLTGGTARSGARVDRAQAQCQRLFGHGAGHRRRSALARRAAAESRHSETARAAQLPARQRGGAGGVGSRGGGDHCREQSVGDIRREFLLGYRPDPALDSLRQLDHRPGAGCHSRPRHRHSRNAHGLRHCRGSADHCAVRQQAAPRRWSPASGCCSWRATRSSRSGDRPLRRCRRPRRRARCA